ncbi:MAG: DUF87 domain-containing protein [Nitrososphaerales archaeon]
MSFERQRVIGVIASESSETEARVILNYKEELNIKTEDLVVVENLIGGKVLAVLRGGRGLNENLKTGGYHPALSYARIGGNPSKAKESYDFRLLVIGEITEEGLVQNKKILSPGSPVRLFSEKDDPMVYLSKNKGFTLGYYEGRPNWKVPVNIDFIPYHIGVFATTGGGKSYLARYEIIPLLKKAGYGVLILDWKGRDYAPYFKDVISIADIALDTESVKDYLIRLFGNFGYSTDTNLPRQALEAYLEKEEWRGLGEKDLKDSLKEGIIEEIKLLKDRRSEEAINRVELAFKKIQSRELSFILGIKTPENVLEEVREKGIVVINMKKASKHIKLLCFLALGKYLMDMMYNDEDPNLALVIDEGPQYCGFNPIGIEKETTDIIIDMCALGRSHKLCICLLSQGIAGEIGINAAVRRNLNTQLIGKIHPLDMNEASNWLSPYNIDPKFLLSLPPGHFYFMGSMNPSPMPLLITFAIG